MDHEIRLAQNAVEAAQRANTIALWALIISFAISCLGLLLTVMNWRLRPLLRVHIYRENDKTYFGESSLLTNGNHAVFFHLAVENLRGWIPAKGTKVVVKAVYDRVGVYWKERHIAGNLRLSWQHWTEEPQNPFRVVGPDLHVADFCVVSSQGAAFMLGGARPAIFPGELKPKEELLLKIVAIAEEASSPPLFLRVCWDGVRYGTFGACTPEEFRKHIVIERHCGV